MHGGNTLARWTRTFSDDSDVSLQFYYDRADRDNNIGLLNQQFNTYNVDFRYHFPIGCYHNVVCGLGYRVVHDKIPSITARRRWNLFRSGGAQASDTFHAFAQDEVELTDDWFFTLGAKLQHNDFTQWEVQPTGRLLYSPKKHGQLGDPLERSSAHAFRIESDAAIASTVPFLDFVRLDSEELIAYELGYRAAGEALVFLGYRPVLQPVSEPILHPPHSGDPVASL